MQNQTSKRSIIFYGTIFSAIRMLIGGISALYLIAKGVSLEEIGQMKALQAATILFLDIPLAYTSDKYSRTLSIKIASLFSMIWLLLMAYSNSFELFMLAEFFNAISLSLFNGAFISYLLYKTNNDDKKTLLSKYTKTQHIGMALAALLGPFLIKDISSSSLWYIASFLMFSLFISSFYVFKPEKNNKDNEHFISKTILKDLATAFLQIKSLYILIIPSIIIGFVYQISIQYWQPVLKEMANISSDAYIWGVIFFTILMVQSLSGYVVEKFQTSKILYVALFISFIFPFIYNEKTIFYMIFILFLFFIIRFLLIIMSSKIHQQIEDHNRGTVDAVRSVIFSLIVVIFMPYVGLFLSKIIY